METASKTWPGPSLIPIRFSDPTSSKQHRPSQGSVGERGRTLRAATAFSFDTVHTESGERAFSRFPMRAGYGLVWVCVAVASSAMDDDCSPAPVASTELAL
ncbi:uncharacterized protein [Physcomitrium patens]|uniref:uncharacterized protein n=1 Tax=Physcomitrium patens TaxID=3218 RepID=UPI003CCDF13C